MTLTRLDFIFQTSFSSFHLSVSLSYSHVDTGMSYKVNWGSLSKFFQQWGFMLYEFLRKKMSITILHMRFVLLIE